MVYRSNQHSKLLCLYNQTSTANNRARIEPRMPNPQPDVVIVGNGPAGSLLMLYLTTFTKLNIVNISKSDLNCNRGWSGTYGR